MMKRMLAMCVSVVAFGLAAGGCEKKGETGGGAASGSSAAAPATGLPSGLFLASVPEAALEVKAAKAAVKQGERVVMRGRIGGSVDPFVDGRAIFTLMDVALPACSDNPDDHCTTPWDYCCETRKDIVAHAATVRVSDAEGRPLRVSLKGVSGLRELVEVIVVGTVSERDDAGNFVVDASGLYVAAKAGT